METKRLDFGETFRDALSIGVKNAPSVIAAVALWLVTIWIPYLNVGTTIALTLLPTRLAKGEVINPLCIFDSQYRRYMGEFFLTVALMALGIYLGMIFLIVPGLVLSMAWSLAYYFLIEKGKNPIEAIKASNDATYGSKWTMFAVSLVFSIAALVICFACIALCNAIGSTFLRVLVMLVLAILFMAISMAINASFWKQLRDNVE